MSVGTRASASARDSRSVGWAWAAVLATLRSAVYLILASVFLLPAWQTWETTETRSRVVLLIDVSGSMNTKDDVPTDTMPVAKLLTRKDKVVRFLSDEQLAFVKKLQEKNPIVAFRFADDDTGRRAMAAVNADGKAHISSTEVAGRFVLRLAILNRRTTADHVDHVIDIIEKTLAG